MPVIRIGHTPDADDAFMYYAIARGLVPVGEYEVEHVLQDIQTLNQRALSGELEGTAISAGVYPQVADKYRIMRVGSSIGRNYGPMVVATQERAGLRLEGARIAIPGEFTHRLPAPAPVRTGLRGAAHAVRRDRGRSPDRRR